MKKKIILGLLVAVLASTGITAGVKAAPPETDVTGVVTENQMPVAGATVTVTCGGKSEVDTTDPHGSYLVHFVSADCPFGSTVKVVAVKAGKSGVASGTVQGITTKLNLAIVNVSIPEFGLIGSVLASAAGLGFIVYSRRRQERQGFQQ